MAEMEGGVMTRCFVRGAGIAEGTGDVIGEIIGTEESNAHPLFYFVNHRGDTMVAYVQHDTTKTLAAEYRYDAFGNLISSTTNQPSFLPRFTFSTKEYLAEAGVYLYAYRVYDPVAGRWTQRDPVDYEDSPNLYQFCGNNPVNKTDADGRFEMVTLIIIVLVVGVVGTIAYYKLGKTVEKVEDEMKKGAEEILDPDKGDSKRSANAEKTRWKLGKACVTMGKAADPIAEVPQAIPEAVANIDEDPDAPKSDTDKNKNNEKQK